MILLELSSDKKLKLISYTPLYQGENKFDIVKIKLPPKIVGNQTTDYSVELHAIGDDTNYFKYPLSIQNESGSLSACVEVGTDLTETVQSIRLALRFENDEIIGLTNAVPISILAPETEGEEIEPRSQLVDRIAVLEETTDEQATQITQLQTSLTEKTEEAAALTETVRDLSGQVSSLTDTLHETQINLAEVEAERSAMTNAAEALNTTIASTLGGDISE